MTALVLDSRALEVVADPKADLKAAQRMRDMLDSADRMGIPVRVPTAVLAEAARQAGHLRHRDRLNSCHTVDALVVATAIRLGGGIVATGDPDDLRSLAREHANIKVEPLS